MSKSKPNPNEHQITIFEMLARQDQKSTPPLQCAEKFGFRLNYYDVDGKPEHYLYHAGQWVAGLTNNNPDYRKTLSRIKSKLSKRLADDTVTNSPQYKIAKLPFQADNGNIYQVDYVSEDYAYLIVQEIPEKQQSPQIEAMKHYLAQAGAHITWEKHNPQPAAAFHLSRTEGIKARNQFTENAYRSHITKSPRYDRLTNATYHHLGLSQKEQTATGEIIRQLQLTQSQARHIRDHISAIALDAIRMAESAAAIEMANQNQLTDEEQLSIVREMAAIVAPSLWGLARRLNTNPITGQPLLGGE